MPERYDEHYVRSVVRMGDSRNVYTNQAIFTSNRIKLVETGIKVDSALYDRLVSHKLIPKLDECLSVDNGITQKHLLDYARDLLESDPRLSVISSDAKVRDRILQAFAEIPLLPPLAFKLTVASEQRPEIYEHSVRVALLAVFLAVKSYFLSRKELASLAAAGVFHDLGILHIPPDLLSAGRRLEKFERHYLYAHPITGFLLLRRFAEYHPEISRTVFEHHERLDGSGYPRGLKADEICLGAQVLMLAEVANTVFERSANSQTLAKLSVLLRLNQKKFNSDLAGKLVSLLQNMAGDATDRVAGEAAEFLEASSFERKLSEVARVFEQWHETTLSLDGDGGSGSPCQLFSIIEERIRGLQHSLHYAGFDLQDRDVLTRMGREDKEALRELSILVGETHWQLSEIIHEAYRRLNEDASAKCQGEHPVIRWIENSEKVLQIY